MTAVPTRMDAPSDNLDGPPLDVRPLRIAQILVGFRSDGGAEQLVRTLLTEMRELPCHADVIILQQAQPGGASELQSLDAALIPLPARRLVDPRRFVRLVRQLRAGRYDVVHTHLSSANILGVVAGRLVGLPTVVTLHSTRSAADAHWYHGRLERFVLRRLATTIIAVGEETARVQRERLGRADIVVLPNAIGPSAPIDDRLRAQLRREIMTDPGRHLVLSVGRLESPKGFPELIDAFASMIERGIDAELVIVGRGSMVGEIEVAIDERGVGDRVHLMGVRADVRELMQAADLFAMSSRWEGLPIVLLEAMQSRTAIVGTDVGDIRAVLEATPSRVVEPCRPDLLAVAMEQTLVDIEHGCDLTTAGHRTVSERFSSRSWASMVHQLYLSALDKR